MSATANSVELLRRHNLRIFTTADFLTLTQSTATTTVQRLRRLMAAGLLSRLKRGVWINRLAPRIHPAEALSALAAPWPAYLSLQSALSWHGRVQEIPSRILAVTAGRSARYSTAIGEYSLHHLPPHLIWGFHLERHADAWIPIAEPEKAFLDTVYLGLLPRSPIGLPYTREKRWKLDLTRLRAYAGRFHYPPLTAYIRRIRLTPR